MVKSRHAFSRRYVAEPASVSAARRAVAAFAGEAGADPHQVAAIRLAVSEAVTNAVLHGYRGAPGEIRVSAEVRGSELSIVVLDGGRGLDCVAETPGLGVGLTLIAEVADGMAIAPRSGGGVQMRMRFALAAPSAPTAPSASRRTQPVRAGQTAAA